MPGIFALRDRLPIKTKANSQPLVDENIGLRTIHKPHALVISRRLAIWRVDIITLGLYKGISLTVIATEGENVRCHAIICFGPGTHLDGSSLHQTGALGLPSLRVEVLPVTLQRWFCMYMFGWPPVFLSAMVNRGRFKGERTYSRQGSRAKRNSNLPQDRAAGPWGHHTKSP